jgi:hypothetical protein
MEDGCESEHPKKRKIKRVKKKKKKLKNFLERKRKIGKRWRTSRIEWKLR